jgi:hypothetical protein
VDDWRVSEGSVVDNWTVRGEDWLLNTAICPACGYPKVGPGLCECCRAVLVP